MLRKLTDKFVQIGTAEYAPTVVNTGKVSIIVRRCRPDDHAQGMDLPILPPGGRYCPMSNDSGEVFLARGLEPGAEVYVDAPQPRFRATA